MIDDRKQSETTLEHAEASLDTSEDRVKENNATPTNAPGDKPSTESASNSANKSESELESPSESGDSDLRDQHLDETLDDLPSETLELKDLEFDGTDEGAGSASTQPEIGISGEKRDATIRDTPPQVQAAQLQIMEALQLEIESLKQQLAKQTEQADSVKAQSVRIAADFDNFRKRTQKEKEDLEVFAKRNTINELLPVVDNFERARSQIRPANDGEMGIHKSYQGVYKNLVDCLKRLGVSAMRPEGQEFDPNYHEAMLREQTSEYAEGTVIEQLVRGYMIGDRVLRHAMVKVAAAPEEETNSSTEGNIDSNSGSESSSEQ